MMIEKIDFGDEEQFDKFRQQFPPEFIDNMLRSAIRGAWMILPKEKKTIDEVEKQIRRMVDRAFRDMRDDFDNFLCKS